MYMMRHGLLSIAKITTKKHCRHARYQPRDIFNAKKIILKLDPFMQSLKKIGKEMSKIESEKTIYNINQGP